jgi:hypothetical protein
MKRLLAFASAAEALTGVALLIAPSAAGRVLFNSEITGAGVFMSRIAGFALIGIGLGCWPEDNMRRAFHTMLTYSTLVLLYLVVVGIGGHAGILLWPAVAYHACLSVLLVLLWRKQAHVV